MLAVGETGSLKKGTESRGARQYSGLADRVENWQARVAFGYATKKG